MLMATPEGAYTAENLCGSREAPGMPRAQLVAYRFDDLELLCFLSLTARLCAIALCPTVVQQQKAGPEQVKQAAHISIIVRQDIRRHHAICMNA